MENKMEKKIERRGNPNWKKGVSANQKGRPIGSFNKIMLARSIILDALLKNEKEFREQLEAAAEKNPVGFYLKFVLPFMPRTRDLDEKASSDMAATNAISVKIIMNKPTDAGDKIIDV